MIHVSPPRPLGPIQRTVVDRLRAAAATRLKLDLRPVQIAAGTLLLERRIAEMQTGEGKTLTTVLPAAVLATRHKVLVATANDYLAARDSDWMRELYRDLGLSVGCVTSASTPTERRTAYASDVTYGTLREFAFDHLRDGLSRRQPSRSAVKVRCPLEALIVDEADSVLIDEATTPLVITAATTAVDAAREACYRWSAEIAPRFRAVEDYVRLASGGAIALTESGRRKFLQAEMPAAMGPLSTTEILHAVERAIWVNQTIHRDAHYVVDDGRIQLVDEYTGRKSAQRNFGGGIHQAIEAREGLSLTAESAPVARITVQDFVGKFSHLCGITATAWEDRHELRGVYGLTVHTVPTHQSSRRQVLPAVVSRTTAEKWQRIAEETRQMIAGGRGVLVGTRTVAQSEQLSERFRNLKIEHFVLNARNPEHEAEVIAKAGTPGRVTVATNMAGRGTDIRLDAEVAAVGGLHVIVSGPHAAARIDRQLMGRCGRQGDPGTTRLHASAEDEILAQAFGIERAEQICKTAIVGASDRWILAKLRRAQRVVARNQRTERARLTAHEAALADALRRLGLDPHLDPLPTTK